MLIKLESFLVILCMFQGQVGGALGWEHSVSSSGSFYKCCYIGNPSSHAPQFLSANSITGQMVKRVQDSWRRHYCPTGLYIFHSMALGASLSSVLLLSLSTVIRLIFLSLEDVVRVCYRKKMFCVFLSVREPLVTVQLLGFSIHLSCYNLSYKTRKTANRRSQAWSFIPHSTAYFTV